MDKPARLRNAAPSVTAPDVTVVGPTTLDLIRVPGDRCARRSPGGAVLYTALTLHQLGRRVEVITKVAPRDRAFLLAPFLERGIDVRCLPTETSTTFENTYLDRAQTRRRQRVPAQADPFRPEEIQLARAPWIHLGPLTEHDCPAADVPALARWGRKISVDGQGWTRGVDGDQVTPAKPTLSTHTLPVEVLKLDRGEAEALFGGGETRPGVDVLAKRTHAAGAATTLITAADRGAWLSTPDRAEPERIPAFRPPQIRDATGCGDTFIAGFLHQIWAGRDASDAAHFASALAALRLTALGPFAGTERAVWRFWAAQAAGRPPGSVVAPSAHPPLK